jgi:hypothetical protein
MESQILHEENEKGQGSDEDLDYGELTSHKIDKNVLSLKRKKRLIVILEHAYGY